MIKILLSELVLVKFLEMIFWLRVFKVFVEILIYPSIHKTTIVYYIFAVLG